MTPRQGAVAPHWMIALKRGQSLTSWHWAYFCDSDRTHLSWLPTWRRHSSWFLLLHMIVMSSGSPGLTKWPSLPRYKSSDLQELCLGCLPVPFYLTQWLDTTWRIFWRAMKHLFNSFSTPHMLTILSQVWAQKKQHLTSTLSPRPCSVMEGSISASLCLIPESCSNELTVKKEHNQDPRVTLNSRTQATLGTTPTLNSGEHKIWGFCGILVHVATILFSNSQY